MTAPPSPQLHKSIHEIYSYEGEVPGQNDDNQTSDILEAGETVSQVAEVRQTTITRQYFHKKRLNYINSYFIINIFLICVTDRRRNGRNRKRLI